MTLIDGTEAVILGNPHTWPGRFDVLDLQGGDIVTCSLSDIAKASDAALDRLRFEHIPEEVI